jgi:hypothetical protein
MKKLLFILFLFALFSCEKDERGYWQCTNTIVRSIPGFIPDTTVYVQLYNLTDDEVLDLLRFQTYSGTQEHNGAAYYIESKCSCARGICPK